MTLTPDEPFDCDDMQITVKLGDDEAKTYWAKAAGVDEVMGGTRYKLLPMDRS